MGSKLTDKEFKERIFKLVGNEYSFLDKYQGTDTNITCRHNICGYTWKIRPSNFYHGNRCPRCSHKRAGLLKTKNTKWYKQKVFNLVGNSYKVLGKYINSSTPIKMKHTICNYEWCVTPNNFLKGRRCPRCKFKRLSENWSKDHKANILDKTKLLDYIDRIRSYGFIVLGTYSGFHKKIEVACPKCNYHWNPRFDDLLYNKTSCPRCTKESKGEKFVREFLEDNNINYESQKVFKDLKDKQSLSYDFYLPTSNTLLEYQGGQHYFPVKYLGGEKRFCRQQRHDYMKYKYAQLKNIRLIYIPYLCNTYEKVCSLLKMWKLN